MVTQSGHVQRMMMAAHSRCASPLAQQYRLAFTAIIELRPPL
jgi:hypothetical protein